MMENSSLNRSEIERKKSRQRSRVANGSAVLGGIDGRSLWCRRLKENLEDHFSDIPDASVAERSLIRRASVLEVELERMETAFALAGQASVEDLDVYARVAANLRRLLEATGLKRRPRDVSPAQSFSELLRQDALQQQRDDAERNAVKREAFEAEQQAKQTIEADGS
jgi:hypothetical protein